VAPFSSRRPRRCPPALARGRLQQRPRPATLHQPTLGLFELWYSTIPYLPCRFEKCRMIHHTLVLPRSATRPIKDRRCWETGPPLSSRLSCGSSTAASAATCCCHVTSSPAVRGRRNRPVAPVRGVERFPARAGSAARPVYVGRLHGDCVRLGSRSATESTWAIPYLGLPRLLRRRPASAGPPGTSGYIPLGRLPRTTLLVADLNGDGKDDLVAVQYRLTGESLYFGLRRSTGTAFWMPAASDRDIPVWWRARPQRRISSRRPERRRPGRPGDLHRHGPGRGLRSGLLRLQAGRLHHTALRRTSPPRLVRARPHDRSSGRLRAGLPQRRLHLSTATTGRSPTLGFRSTGTGLSFTLPLTATCPAGTDWPGNDQFLRRRHRRRRGVPTCGYGTRRLATEYLVRITARHPRKADDVGDRVGRVEPGRVRRLRAGPDDHLSGDPQLLLHILRLVSSASTAARHRRSTHLYRGFNPYPYGRTG